MTTKPIKAPYVVGHRDGYRDSAVFHRYMIGKDLKWRWVCDCYGDDAAKLICRLLNEEEAKRVGE